MEELKEATATALLEAIKEAAGQGASRRGEHLEALARAYAMVTGVPLVEKNPGVSNQMYVMR
ncbi:hypothetical protein ACQR35_10925 [Pseudarthrobacter sp. J1738]|uniref:hypothetical protein n=1 Tax=Pseudarthrobacter sp. J1738 TaxID=3420446 RepID=UPI003D2CEE40